ncbi:MAG: hypothetical protein HYZ85_05365 [Candidatus Omnitrophica bacterium]|nr:hypothetical protein [Candidatus Omnitrophota bacterium]
MKRDLVPVGFAFIFLFFSSPAFANILGNPGFEEDIGSGTGQDWDSTNGMTRVTTATLPGGGFSAVPEGNFALEAANATDFTFQTFDNVKPGDFVVFSALAESTVAVGGGAQGGQVRIEFKSRHLHNDTDTLISAVNSALITGGGGGSAPAGAGYVRFSAQGTAPEGTGRVVFVLRGTGGVAGDLVFDSAHAEIKPAKLHVAASKSEVKAGDIVTVSASFFNSSLTAFNNVDLVATIPKGLNLVNDTVRVNGGQAGFREGSLIVTIGTLSPSARFEIVFQTLVTSAVTVGKEYEIEVFVNNGGNLSESGHVRLRVKEDPLLDHGTLIGKVFHDENQNGVQDRGEKGVPWIRLATEEGIVIVTDEHGKFHVPGIKSGRHIIKIDGHSLPEGTQFITEESYLFKTTPGILNKVDFAVLLPPSKLPESFQKDLNVVITQGLDTSRPDLGVKMEPTLLKAGVGVFETRPTFEFTINYPDYVKIWRLEIRDELGHEIWTGFGVGSPPAEVPWEGHDESGLFVKPGLYSYQFRVEDKAGREDWTPLSFFRIVSKADSLAKQNQQIEIPPIGDFNLFKDGKQSIPLIAKPTVRIQGITRPGHEVSINGRRVSVDAESGRFQTEFYATPGEKEFQVTSASPEGDVVSYRETVNVKDSTFFMVALGEEQLGVNFQDGDIESAGNGDVFRNGFYQEGRLSYYLKGKLKGKFLVKSHYDTSDARSALFTNLDPEDYYPVYGDASSRDYEAQDSRDRFYLVVEMDRSFVKWGSFKTEFNDTELSTYNRTLSGLKLHYETLSSTAYGDPKRGFKVFSSKANHRADHNEFAATGGSLYYLRNRRLIEGSEKLRVEIRDKIQDIALESYDLREGQDYEIDYDEGRILLSRPLSSVAASDTIISRDMLDGSPVYLIADYEFEADPSAFETDNRGLRGYTHLGDHVRIGATAIEEKRQNVDYDLRGVDATVKIGRNTKISAEYAETQRQQTLQSVSYNGGLSFRDVGLQRSRRLRESAYWIKGESKPVKNLETSAYWGITEPGFSTHHSLSQEGLRKYGMAAKYKFTDDFSLRYRHDTRELASQLRPLQEKQVFAPLERMRSHTAQATYDDGQWLAEAEYLNQDSELPIENLLPSPFSEISYDHAVGGKLGYHFNERLLPYFKTQYSFGGISNHQWGGGVRYEIVKDLFAYLEQMLGNNGDSTYFGFEKFHQNGARSYVNLRTFDRGIGNKTVSTTVGNSFSLTEKSRVYSEREYSSYLSEDGYADILGYEGKMTDRWDYDLKFERRHLDNSRTRLLDDQASQSFLRANTFNAWSGALAYAEGKKLRARTFWEFRRDQDAPEAWQWVTRDSVEFQVNQDLSFLGKFDFGKSRFLDPEGTPASFAQLSTGFAFRPMEHDRFNALARYTFVKDIANDLQFSTDLYEAIPTDETAHIWSVDFAYDLYKFLQVVEKLAYKRGIFSTAVSDEVGVSNFLWAHRFNFHVTRKWDVALEYRALWQREIADSLRHGPLVEIDREFYDYVRLGVGYNFTDFDDDLRRANNYNSHGPFVRLTGKF